MSLRINHNTGALNAWRHLTNNDFMMNKSLERLSSGLRINSAADDPAGLSISEKLRAQVASLNQAVENSEQASSMINTAEAAMNEIHNLLTTMREPMPVSDVKLAGNLPITAVAHTSTARVPATAETSAVGLT